MESTEGPQTVVNSRQNWLVHSSAADNERKLVASYELNHDSRINASTGGNMFCSCKNLDFNDAVK